jgi:hypothetical protein
MLCSVLCAYLCRDAYELVRRRLFHHDSIITKKRMSGKLLESHKRVGVSKMGDR